MAVTYRDIIAIVQLIFYLPCAIVAVFLAFRHGFGRLAGWFFLIIFSLLRIAGSIIRFIAISKPTDRGLITGEIICSAVGLSPLALILLALLSRVNMFTHNGFPPIVFRVLHLAGLVGAILGIVGGQNSIKNGSFVANGQAQASIAIFIFIFAAIVILLALQSVRLSSIDKGEKRLLLAVAICCPFYLVRLIYSCLSTLGHLRNFNFMTGNETIYLFMAVLEEFVIVAVCLGVGLTLRVVPKGQSISEQRQEYNMAPQASQGEELSNMAYQGAGQYNDSRQGKPNAPAWPNTGRGREQRSDRGRRQGPIRYLIGRGIDMYGSRRNAS